jgi:UDP-N-acetylmuramate dehydrogenase
MQAFIEKADKDMLRARASELLKDRAQKQPLEIPNAGCIFRNPTGAGAGRLIDSCGLKGSRIGGAMVSTKHANFIVNAANAKSSDVRTLIDKVRQEVFDRFGERLEPEIRLVGDWDER